MTIQISKRGHFFHLSLNSNFKFYSWLFIYILSPAIPKLQFDSPYFNSFLSHFYIAANNQGYGLANTLRREFSRTLYWDRQVRFIRHMS